MCIESIHVQYFEVRFKTYLSPPHTKSAKICTTESRTAWMLDLNQRCDTQHDMYKTRNPASPLATSRDASRCRQADHRRKARACCSLSMSTRRTLGRLFRNSTTPTVDAMRSNTRTAHLVRIWGICGLFIWVWLMGVDVSVPLAVSWVVLGACRMVRVALLVFQTCGLHLDVVVRGTKRRDGIE